MPQIDDTSGPKPHHDVNITTGVGDGIPGRKRRSATPSGLRRREFERLQLLCRLDLPMRQFLPAILPYLRELVPASCAFVIWSDPQGNTALLRESPRAIALETQTPRACEVHYALHEYFSGTSLGGRRCGLIPLHVLGLDEAACAYRPAIAAVLAVKLEDSQGLNGFLCLCRSSPAQLFSVTQQAMLVKLTAEFARALSCKPAAPDALAVPAEAGFIVANAQGEIQSACPRAKNYLSMLMESRFRSFNQKAELPAELQQRIAAILDPEKPTEAVWRYRNSWGDFQFRARLLRERGSPATRSVAVDVTREEPLALQVFRKCRQQQLTARQTEIVIALARGQSCPTIGKQLNIGSHTVVDHVRKLCRRLDVPNRDMVVVRLLT